MQWHWKHFLGNMDQKEMPNLATSADRKQRGG